MTANFFISSSHFDLLSVDGADAARFLQGQLSCDVNSLSDPGYCYGAALNTKGRVIAPFVLLTTESGFLLVLNKGLGQILRSHLERFLPFYKSHLETAENFNFVILYGPDPLIKLTNRVDTHLPSGTAELLPTGRHYNIGSKLFNAHLLSIEALPPGFLLSGDLQESNYDSWSLVAARHGHYPFNSEDSGQYTAQELRLEHNGYISFEKGCYTGQEIVARMHYRSTPKKQLFRVEFFKPDANTPNEDNLQLMNMTGQACARFLKLLPAGNSRWCGFVHLPIDPFPDTSTYKVDSGEIYSLQLF